MFPLYESRPTVSWDDLVSGDVFVDAGYDTLSCDILILLIKGRQKIAYHLNSEDGSVETTFSHSAAARFPLPQYKVLFNIKTLTDKLK